jgi:DNA transposition AAA+ family ATPase
MALTGTQEAGIVPTPAFTAIEKMADLVVPRREIALIHGPHFTGKRTALWTYLNSQSLAVTRVALAGGESNRKLLALLHDQIIAPDDLPARDLQDDLVEALREQPRIVVVENAHRLSAEAAAQIEWLHGRDAQQAAYFLVGGPDTAKAVGKDPLLWASICSTVEVTPLTGEDLFRTLQSMHALFLGAGTELLAEIDSKVCHGVIGHWARFLQHALHLRDQIVANGNDQPVLNRKFARAVIQTMPATTLKQKK